MIKNDNRQTGFSGWVKFFLIAVLFPVLAVCYSLFQVAKLQSEIRLQQFKISAADKMDQLSEATNADEYICRNLNDIFEQSHDERDLQKNVAAFSAEYELDCHFFIWNDAGAVVWSNFDHEQYGADLKLAFTTLHRATEIDKEFISWEEDTNLRKLFGPHFFARYHHQCFWNSRPRLIRGDSAEKWPRAWVRADRNFGLVVFIQPEKYAGIKILSQLAMNFPVAKNSSVGVFADDKVFTASEKLKKLMPKYGELLKGSYENLHRLGEFYFYKSYLAEKIFGLNLIPADQIEGLALSLWVKVLLALFVCLLLVITIVSYQIYVNGKALIMNIRKQLVVLFMMSNAFPLLILGVLGYDYLKQYENYLRIEVFSQGMIYLQNIDEMYLSEFTYQLRKMNDAFAWLPEELKKKTVDRQMIEKFLAHQSVKPFRLMLVGSHTPRVGSEIGIYENDSFVSVIDKELASYESMGTLVDSLDQMGKYYLSRLNHESIPDKQMLQIEMIAEALGQIKPIEMIQEFFAATGYFWQWGMGRHYYPAHVRVLRLFDPEIYDYVFLYLYPPDLLQYAYFQRVVDAVNRNETGLTIVAVNDKINMTIPESFLENAELKKYASRLRNKSGAEMEFHSWNGAEHMLMGLKCSSADRLRLLGLYPVAEISRKAGVKYWLFMASGLLSLLIALSLGLIVSRSFLSPLSELQKGVDALKNREFAYRLPDLGNDEFGRLANIFNSTMVDLEELQVASVVQEKISTDISQDARAGCFCFAGITKSFFRLGGDFVDYFSLDENRSVIIIGDVAGQGVGSALVMAFVKSCLLQLKDFLDNPIFVVERINQFINDTNTRKSRKFMTIQLAFLDGNSGRVTVANAGHCFPILCNEKTGQCRSLEMPSSPLGASRKSRFFSFSHELHRDESLILYSGGMYRNPGQTFAGFMNLLSGTLADSPQKFCAELMTKALEKSESADFKDDLSIICIRKNTDLGS